MKHMTTTTIGIKCLILLLMAAIGCERSDHQTDSASSETVDDILPSDRVAIPLAVRSNLGITAHSGMWNAGRSRTRCVRRGGSNTSRLPRGTTTSCSLEESSCSSINSTRSRRVRRSIASIHHWREIQQSIASADAKLKSATAELWASSRSWPLTPVMNTTSPRT